MKKKLFFILGGVLITSLLIIGIVYAFQMGNVDGVWGQVDVGGATPIDVIGRIGETGPWGATTATDTDEVVLRRKSTICIGDSNGSDAFNPATQWNFITEGTTIGLGDSVGLCASTSGLIISEYYESDNTARAIEIYNGTGASVNLNNYTIVVYTNGSSVYSEICFLHGLLATGEVHVLTDGDDDFTTISDEVCGSLNFTGNDAVELRRGNEADAYDSRWASGDGDTPTYEQGTHWDQTTGHTGVTNTDTNQVRYGLPADNGSGFADQSGLGFDGVNAVGPITPGSPPGTPSSPFLLGLLTHYNNPILRYTSTNVHYNNLYQVPLDITITGIYCDTTSSYPPVGAGSGGATLTFAYNVRLEETPNELTCPYGATVGGFCDDRIWIIGSSGVSASFDCRIEGLDPQYQGLWTVEVLGFTNNGTSTTCPSTPAGPVIYNFDSGETQDSTACLYARVAAFDPTAVTFANFSAQPGPDGILVSWGTVSEVNNSGFYLYRSTTTTKPFEPMTTFIPSQAPGSGEGANYEFFDANVQSGVKYFYWLESVDFEDRAVDEYGPAAARAFHRLFLPLIGR